MSCTYRSILLLLVLSPEAPPETNPYIKRFLGTARLLFNGHDNDAKGGRGVILCGVVESESLANE